MTNTKKLPIALQVYSVRDFAAKDLAGTLKKIATMGYQGVEFAGYYNIEAGEIKKMLDDHSLKCIGAHLQVKDLLGEQFEKTVEFQKTLGNPSLIVAGGLAQAYATDAGNRMAAYLFNEFSLKAEKVGMRVGFHAHGGDFTVIDGKTAWDLFFTRTRKEVIAQMDVGNALYGGADPYAAIKKFPGRGQLIHVKSFGPKGTIVGDENDKVDWPKVFSLCETVAGTEWYIVEQESAPGQMTSLEASEIALKNLRKMGK